ncbi:MAG: thiamine pyrophosphate-dependent enzyme [bacterium]
MINRVEGCRYLVGKLSDELVVASLGNPAYDLAAGGDRDLNFYMWNAMGLAGPMGLGLAHARPDTKVIVLDGDGALLMHLGALATEAVSNPPNLIHIVWDNRMYHLTGRQPTATAYRTDLAQVAAACGFESVAACENLDDFKKEVDRALATPGPHFIHALNDDADREGELPPSPTFIKHRFMTALGVEH